MFPQQLKKILDLAKQSGDSVILYDSSRPEESYVISSFERYEALVAGKSAPSSSPAVPHNLPTAEKLEDYGKKPAETPEKENLTEEDLTDKINREISLWKNRDNASVLGEDNKPKKPWSIPPQVKDKAQEVQ